MKKVLVAFSVVFLLPGVSMAQFGGQGSVDINAGIGLGSTLTGTGLPVSLMVDYGFTDEISIGGYFGFAATKEDIGIGSWKYTNLILGARGAYHKEFIDNIDTYGGAMLGYNIASAKWDGPGSLKASAGGVTYSLFVGARYRFSEKLGAYAELGYGIAYLQTGITVRM